MTTSADSGRAVGYANLKPFQKGADPRRAKGNLPKSVRLAKKALAKLTPRAVEKLAAWLEGDDPDLAKFAVERILKHNIPVARDPVEVDLGIGVRVPRIPPSLATILASLPEGREQ